MRYYYVVFVLGLVASVSAFSVLPQPQNTRVYRLHGLTESAIEYIQKLPPTLSTKEERARLISWYCRLRDLNHARNRLDATIINFYHNIMSQNIVTKNMNKFQVNSTFGPINVTFFLCLFKEVPESDLFRAASRNVT